MPIASIDPNVRESVSSQKTTPNRGQDFADFMSTAAVGAAPTAVGVAKGYQPAAVTNASITGVASGVNTFANPSTLSYGAGYGGNAPYYSSPSVFSASGGLTTATNGYQLSNTPFNGGISGGTNSLYGNVGSGVSSDTVARAQLFQQMNDASWDMLVAQVTVNDISRDYQARSNILKSKSDTEVSIARNMRA